MGRLADDGASRWVRGYGMDGIFGWTFVFDGIGCSDPRNRIVINLTSICGESGFIPRRRLILRRSLPLDLRADANRNFDISLQPA